MRVDLTSNDIPVAELGCLLREMMQLSRSFKVQITSVLVELFKVLNSLCTHYLIHVLCSIPLIAVQMPALPVTICVFSQKYAKSPPSAEKSAKVHLVCSSRFSKLVQNENCVEIRVKFTHIN